ncbi:hypothetical protein ZYGR_0N01020 [Zygosaccharomyces rouxii]|uniref:ZYRO0D02794p n=2 Tax=Zygosaccharomyces rouxii TaxID=4956 RepID=C5DV01_ZYGRC|nr:uncharacterized protein ZYRO0D02794g [Zygosaccharomyces rouxii]KAH9200534.1 hypothetical protein LQ764DRAFT_95853 [Zygosaccharomyces rouxii]GAV48698.1 hypothetical protein ZYGR_0N01020 [Zygosaccharomyces rouxii]CAR27620.1 ZYRO0D02794p [Zygosaccharomyces rouxii]
MKPELQTYKSLIKAFVRADRTARIAQRAAERKQQLALLTYRRMNIAREQAKKDIDPSTRMKLIKDMATLNKRVEILKQKAPENDKKLLFVQDTSFLRDQILSAQDDRHIQHLEDIAAFVDNQREYDELIERYNPGARMSQEEKVKRTANKVGFQMPS